MKTLLLILLILFILFMIVLTYSLCVMAGRESDDWQEEWIRSQNDEWKKEQDKENNEENSG